MTHTAHRTLTRTASLTLCAAGLALAGQAAAIPARALAAQTLLERVFTQQQVAPLPLATSAIADARPVARLGVARLGISEIVVSGKSRQALAQAPGMVRNGLSQAGGTTVIAAHRDTHFVFIKDLREGDEITLEQADGTNARFRVIRFETVHWDRFAVPKSDDRQQLALATCYPFEGPVGSPLRRVAWAERID
jgi:sortase A